MIIDQIIIANETKRAKRLGKPGPGLAWKIKGNKGSKSTIISKRRIIIVQLYMSRNRNKAYGETIQGKIKISILTNIRIHLNLKKGLKEIKGSRKKRKVR